MNNYSPYNKAPSRIQPRVQYVLSRRGKKEQQKIIKQIIFFSVTAVILLALFVIVIIPNLIRWVGSKDKTPIVVVDDLPPPQPPQIAAPVYATSSAALSLSGFSSAHTTVVVSNNGQEIARDGTHDDGSFQISLTLTKGDNHLSALAIDDKNRQSPASREYVVSYITDPPKLDISEPQDKQAIVGKKNQNLTIKGKADKNTKVTLNDRILFNRDDGSFSTLQMLQTGDNTLDFKVTDQAGNQTEKKLTVSYHD